MVFKFHDELTIEERADLGGRNFALAANKIVPFSNDWDIGSVTSSFRRGGSGQIFPLLNGGYSEGPLYLYHDGQGRRIAAVLRLNHPTEGKQVFPLRATQWRGPPGFEARAIVAPTPLYNLHLLAASPDKPVLLVEGEKAADAGTMLFLDYVVTTWSGGTPGLAKADWRALAGREVTIWPDNDEAGLSAAEKIVPLLQDIGAKSVRVVQLPVGFPPKWDIADPVPELIDG